MLETAGRALINPPRVLPNPQLDRLMRAGYNTYIAGTAADQLNKANTARQAYDQQVREKALGASSPTMANTYNQFTSGNFVKRLLGQSPHLIPENSPLAALNYPLQQSLVPSAKEMGRRILQNASSSIKNPAPVDPSVTQMAIPLVKPPAVSSGLVNKYFSGSVDKYLGGKKDNMQIARDILGASLTPEVRANMMKTQQGMQLWDVLEYAHKLQPETAQTFVNNALSIIEGTKKGGHKVGIDTQELIESAMSGAMSSQ